MDIDELRALLQAATRELHAVSRDLPANDRNAEEARAELIEARQAVSEALGLAAAAAITHAEPSGGDVRGALAMRAGGVRACDIVEGELAVLQQQRTDLQKKLNLLGRLQNHDVHQLECSAELLHLEKSNAQEECQALEKEVNHLRSSLQLKSKQLQEASKRGSALSTAGRGLVKEQQVCEAQVERASEIVSLQESTEKHISGVKESIVNLDRHVTQQWKDDFDRAERFRQEWAAEDRRYEEQESELETMVTELQESYENRWHLTERDRIAKINGQARIENQARENCARTMAQLEAEQEGEAAASRRQVEKQRELLSEAGASAAEEMNARADVKRQELQKKVIAVQQYYHPERDRWLLRADQFKRQAMEHKANISKVSALYRVQQQQQLPAPRATDAGSGASPRAASSSRRPSGAGRTPTGGSFSART